MNLKFNPFALIFNAIKRNKNNFKFTFVLLAFFVLAALIFNLLAYKYDYIFNIDTELDRSLIYPISYLAIIAPVFFFKRAKLYFIPMYFIISIGFIFDYAHLFFLEALAGEGTVATLFTMTPDAVYIFVSALGWLEIAVYILGVVFVFIFLLLLLKYLLKHLASTCQSRIYSCILLLPIIIYASRPLYEEVPYLDRYYYPLVKSVSSLRFSAECYNFLAKNAQLLEISKNPKLPENIKANRKGILGVVVIGESATRYNHSLYGYERDTNPKLSTIVDDLILFDDVITEHPITTAVFQSAFLYRDNNENPLASVSDIFIKGGFDVYFISADSIYLRSSAPQKLLFANAKSENIEHITGNNDQDVLLYIKNHLDINPDRNTLIFININGSHAPYKKYYPESFDYFKDTKTVSAFKNLKGRDRQILNEYDNTIRHTDSFLYDTIEHFSKSSKDSFILYFSDHGETPYDDKFRYRGGVKGYPYSYEIPMFLWCSENYKANNTDKFEAAMANKSQPFQTYECLYTILDLAGVDFDSFSYEKSLVSPEFKPQTKRKVFAGRLIYDKSIRSYWDYER